jgi:dihydrodipicolinate synthase/N-acetylneuraminate lyase
MALVRAAESGNWELAAAYQQRIRKLLDLVIPGGVFPAVTAIMNARGMPGKTSPAPMRQLDAEGRAKLFEEPLVQELVGGHA